jgi:hypothetical protein
MTADENQRIATLTTGAIKTTSEKAIKAMMDAVEAAEEKTKEMRDIAVQHAADLTERFTAHVTSCQNALESFHQHHLELLTAAQETTSDMRKASEQYKTEFEQTTKLLAENVNAHVVSCQAAIDSIQKHHLNILNVEPQLPHNGNSEDHIKMVEELNKLRVYAPDEKHQS